MSDKSQEIKIPPNKTCYYRSYKAICISSSLISNGPVPYRVTGLNTNELFTEPRFLWLFEMELHRQKRKCSPSQPTSSKRAQCFTIQAQYSPEQKEEENYVLELKPFSAFPHITFDKVRIGTIKIHTLVVNNPLDVAQSVSVEKFPFEKGFCISKEEFCVPPLGQATIQIAWKPEKTVSCRETVLFKSSAGSRTQAYLHGIAYSPKKQKKCWDKKVGQKNQKMNKPLATCQNKTESNVFMEDRKENLNIINPENEKFVSSTSATHIFSNPQPETSFNHLGVFSDSPIRRQTYTINCMLRESQIGSEIKTLPLYTHMNQSKNENILKEKQTVLNVNHSSILRAEKCQQEILNDSLESTTSEPVVENTSKPIMCSGNSSIIDAVKVFDSESKHLYFGYTPVNSKSKLVSSLALEGSFLTETSEIKKSCLSSFLGKREESITNSSTFVSDCENVGLFPSRNTTNTISPEKRLTITPEVNGYNLQNPSKLNSKHVQVNTVSNSTCISTNHSETSHDINCETVNCENSKTVKADLDVNLCKQFLAADCNDLPNQVVEKDMDPVACTQVFSLPSRSYSSSNFTEHCKEKVHSDLKDLGSLKKSHSSISFQVASADFPKPSRATFNSRPILSPKHKQASKSKHKSIILSKKNQFKRNPIKDLKLLNSAEGTTKKLFKDSSCVLKSCKTKVQDASEIASSSNHGKKTGRYLSQRLNLTKNKTFEKVYQHNPFASFNAYYDEYWMEKQEAAFTNWLNFILTPNDDFRSSEEVQVNCAEIWIESMKDAATMRAPSKEELSFKTYTAAKELNRLRKAACMLYQSEELAGVIKKIEKEVDLKKITVRKDRAIHADLGIKKDLLDMLLSYNPLWLRIGLEALYGEMIFLQNNRDVVGLSRFIILRFLNNPEIASKYAHSAVINYYKPGYEDDIKRFILKKFLLLVYFLDEAKRAHLIDHNPCLFLKSSKYKCSRNLLLTFSREYLMGEGDITKHLRYLGCIVKHEQAPIEEFDYAVRNIAVDLRCGLRLGRVVELLLQDWTISKSLRANTLNRLAKIHNNDVILKALEKASINIEGNIDCRDIVDGNREKTLSLLWQIIFKTQISKKVNLDQLKKENSYLRQSLKLNADFAAFEALLNGCDQAKDFEFDFLNSKLYKENEVIQQLLQWCQNVCAHYGVKVYNFTSSFLDGRALCFILHHYHPNLLQRDKIKLDTSSQYFQKQMEATEDENCPFLSDNREMTSGLLEKLSKNDKENIDLVFQKFQEIGQIPVLSFPSQVPNTLPDEKVIITFISYINIRLMELSVEIRAVRTIQLAYRKWCLRKKQEKLKVQIAAASIIQKYWRDYALCKRKQKEDNAAALIQRSWRVYSAKKELKRLKHEQQVKFMNQNAIVIQAAYRKYRVRKHLVKCQVASIILQKNVRRWLARTHYLKLKKFASKIQSNYRAKVLGSSQRQQFLHLKNIIVHFQGIVRGTLLRRQMKRNNAAAVVIQSCFRGFMIKSRFKKEKVACLAIQSHLRRSICQKRFLKQRNAAKILQNRFRAYLIARKTRESYLKDRKCVTIVQAHIRGWLTRNHFKKLLSSAIKIQATYRSFICRKYYLQKKYAVIVLQRHIRLHLKRKAIERRNFTAAVVIQSACRKFVTRRKFLKMKAACLSIQSHFRRYICQKQFLEQRSAVVVLQKHFRAILIGRETRVSYLKERKSVITVQALTRGWLTRRHIQKLHYCATKIQTAYRTFTCRKYYLRLKESAIILQKQVRSYLFKIAIERKQVAAAIVIQSNYRSFIAKSKFKKDKAACVIIQSHLRGHICRKQFLKQKNAVIVLQTCFRAVLIGKETRQTYLKERNCVIIAQALVRGWLTRRHLQELHRSAIKIQATYRSFIFRKRYLRQKASTIILQKHIRCFLYKKATEKNRMAAAIVIQSSIRCFIARKKFVELKAACVLIQSHLRRQVCQRHYLKQKNAAFVLQIRFRATLIARKIRESYLKDRKSIIFIQALVKGWLIRKHLQNRHNSAVKIQSRYRSYICRKQYLKRRRSIIIIQRLVRSYLCKKAIERKRISSAVTIQSAFRGFIARSKFQKEKAACLIIQSHLRRHIYQKRFLKQKKAVTVIQSRFRAVLIGRKARQSYIKDKKCVITAQALVRGRIARTHIQKLHNSAVKIQAIYRSYICQKQFLKKKKAVTVIQSRFRAVLIGRKARQSYIKDRKCVITAQALVRGRIARTHIQKLHNSAVKIQAVYRSYICQKQFLKQKKAATVIQSRFRAVLIGREARQSYIKDRKCVITAQAIVRGKMARTHIQKLHNSAVKIQAIYRSYICQKQFLKKKKAVTVIQSRFRAVLIGRKARQSYIKDRKCVITAQAIVRGKMARTHIQKLHNSAVKIQAVYRSYICQKQFLKQKKAATVIQSRFRAVLIGKEARQSYTKVRKCVITAQAIVRGWIARKHIQKLHNSAVIIQEIYRSYICRKHFLKKKKSVIILQRSVRSFLCQKANERTRIAAAILIQSFFRGYFAKTNFEKKKAACLIIQSHLRRHICQKHFLMQKRAATVLQNRFRATLVGKWTRESYLKDRKCVITVQAIVRRWITRKKFVKLHSTAVIIQTNYRSFISRKHFLRKRKYVIILQRFIRSYLCQKAIERKRNAASIIIQSSFRGYIARSNFKKKKAGCLVIQSHLRRYICQKQFLRQKWAATVLQNRLRAILIASYTRSSYLKDRKCIITVQAIARGWLTRRHLQQLNSSAIKIQAIYRSFVHRKEFLRKKHSVNILQRHFRAYLCGKRIRLHYLKLQHSACVIQSTWRYFQRNRELLKRVSAATLLQSHFRKLLVRKKFLKLKFSTIVIQRYYLAYKVRLHERYLYEEKVRSCIKIQSYFRSYLVHKKIKKQTSAAVLIQKSFRKWKERKAYLNANQQYLWYSRLRACTIQFQHCARYYLLRRTKAAILIQSYVRMWLARRQYREQKAAIKIQAFWRAYAVRRSITDKKIIASRQNLQKVHDEYSLLKNRTSRALKTLLFDRNLRNILSALQNLDVCTQLSPICCERLEGAKGLSQLILLIRSCNRSVPHQEIIKFSTNILLNLAKHKKTVDSVWAEPDALDVILDLMRIYRDKTAPIFSKCCTLFWIFCQDPVKIQVLKDNSSFTEQIQSYHNLLMKKQAFEEKRCAKSTNAAKSLNVTFLRRFHSMNKRESLQIEPDWMLGRRRRREFKDPFIAISSLMHSLDLKIKTEL